MAQVWEANETSRSWTNTSSFGTLVELLASIKRTFGDPDQERTTVHSDTLRMTLGMMAEEYMASFRDALLLQTSFNEAALESIHGLPQLILLKVYSQTPSFRTGQLKAVVCILDQLQRGFTKLKVVNLAELSRVPSAKCPCVHPNPRHSAPMDINQEQVQAGDPHLL